MPNWFQAIMMIVEKYIENIKNLQGDSISEKFVACTFHKFQYFSLE
jgi:uncharacterized protein YvpB